MTSKPIPIELWPIEKIRPFPLNAKKHPKEQVDALAKSITRFGWTQPIVVDSDGVIIAGHGRRMAAIALGLEKVPVVVRNDLSKTEADALRLADNKVASTEYDAGVMKMAMEEIYKEDPSLLSMAGFNEKEVEFLASDDLADMNDDAFVQDISSAVEAQKAENAKRAAEIDETKSPLADAFGFTRVSINQSRRIRLFITQIEAETGLKGADALVKWIDDVMETTP